MALERIVSNTHDTGYHWIVEGDISKCFDHIDHAILLKRLHHMGVKDRRVLQIIKAMLRAGVMGECEVNEDGTPQGGLISPLLANVYLDILDEWVSNQWESKRTVYPYTSQDSRTAVLKKRSNLIPSYLVRYADDFVIITDTRAHAENWKARLTPYSEEGRQLYFKRTKKKRMQARLDEAFSKEAVQTASSKWARLNNFEFVMNRAYALNRDKLKCKVCSGWLISHIPYTHRINPNLPLNKVNRVDNLVSVHKKCFEAIHNPGMNISEFDRKAQKKILGYREKLGPSHTCNN